MLADGGDCLSDLRAVRDQEPLFGPVASDSTAFRLIDRIASEPALLDALRTARAAARDRAWSVGVPPERIVIRYRRDAGQRAYREGRRGGQLPLRVRVSPDPGVS
jgi:hypothetical protein